MQSSETGIVNLALSTLEEPGILDINGAGRTEQVARLWYAPVRDAALSAYPWNFAKARASLPALAAAPAFEWAAQAQLPADCLTVRKVMGGAREEWEVEGRRLLCNLAAPFDITYTRRIEEVTQFHPLFVHVLALNLAQAMAPEITGSIMREDRVSGRLAELVRHAQRIDAMEKGHEPQPVSDYLTARQS